MVKVYFEYKNHTELVARFSREEEYNKLATYLEREAKSKGATLTESIEEDFSLTPEQLHEVSENMIAFGGSFMRHIGRALQKADQENTKKILHLWGHEITQYLKY